MTARQVVEGPLASSICYELKSRGDKYREPEQREVRLVTREELEERILELARIHAATHDEEVKAELDKLRKRISKMEERLRSSRPLRLTTETMMVRWLDMDFLLIATSAVGWIEWKRLFNWPIVRQIKSIGDAYKGEHPAFRVCPESADSVMLNDRNKGYLVPIS